MGKAGKLNALVFMRIERDQTHMHMFSHLSTNGPTDSVRPLPVRTASPMCLAPQLETETNLTSFTHFQSVRFVTRNRKRINSPTEVLKAATQRAERIVQALAESMHL